MTDLGESVLKTSAQTKTIDGKTYTPKDPLSPVHDTDNEASFTVSCQFHGARNSHDGVASPECQNNTYEDISYNEFHNFIKSYIRERLEATANILGAPYIHAGTVKLRNTQNEKSESGEISPNEERIDGQSSFIGHETGMKQRNLLSDVVRSTVEFLTDLKRIGTYNGRDREYIKEGLWRFLSQSHSREDSFNLLDKLAQDSTIAALIEEIHMARPHAINKDEDVEHATIRSVEVGDGGA